MRLLPLLESSCCSFPFFGCGVSTLVLLNVFLFFPLSCARYRRCVNDGIKRVKRAKNSQHLPLSTSVSLSENSPAFLFSLAIPLRCGVEWFVLFAALSRVTNCCRPTAVGDYSSSFAGFCARRVCWCQIDTAQLCRLTLRANFCGAGQVAAAANDVNARTFVRLQRPLPGEKSILKYNAWGSIRKETIETSLCLLKFPSSSLSKSSGYPTRRVPTNDDNSKSKKRVNVSALVRLLERPQLLTPYRYCYVLKAS